jgi:hypothetical protein
MKFASVKQAVKFGIGAGLPPDKQINLCKDCKLPHPPSCWYKQQYYKIDTNFNYYVNTYKSALTVEPIFHF